MIPKNIFFIWLGNKPPKYCDNMLNAYKEANPTFNIDFIYYSISDIQNILDNKCINEKYDELLKNSINFILTSKNTKNKYQVVIDKPYMYMLDNQKIFYGKDIRFIQLLSDIFRLEVINKYGGIYLDCDTFPLKPFDDELLSKDFFTVRRHYDNLAALKNDESNIGSDNYFIGGNATRDITKNEDDFCFPLIQTDNKWWNNVQYIIRKKKFYDGTLTYKKYNGKFYIEHYFDGNWKIKNNNIRTPICFLDNLYDKN